MKMIFVVALALVATAAAAPQVSPVIISASAAVGSPAPAPAANAPEAPASADAPRKPVQILRSEFDQQPEGGYNFNFETEDGVKREENGELKEILDEEKQPHNVVVVRGQYSYTDPEGQLQTITYYADETGFHAEGDAVPKAAR